MQRVCVVSFALLAGVFGFAGALGTSISPLLALIAAVLVAAVAGRAALALFPERGGRPAALDVAAAVAAIAAVVLVGRLGVFMTDASRSGWSLIPSSQWETKHSCLSAYFVAAEAVGRGHDVYDDALYTAADDDPTRLRKPLTIGAFNVDLFEYPPTFLLLPRALLRVAPDFLRMRSLWFGLSGLVVLAAMLMAARFFPQAGASRALQLVPFVWLAAATLSGLQKGNVQLVVIALSTIAMLLISRRRYALGGAILAFATLSKLYPGVLILYLIVRREWRAVAWIAAMSAALLAATLASFGSAAFTTFTHHLPSLLGGEAFAAFRNPAATAINHSIPGLAFKLKLFGVSGMGFTASKMLGWLWTVVLVWATIRAARAKTGSPIVWLAVLTLATLRSPFLPEGYAAFTPLWLLTLLTATETPSPRATSAAVRAWLALCVFWPVDGGFGPRTLAVLTLVPQIATLVVVYWALRQPSESTVEPVVPALP